MTIPPTLTAIAAMNVEDRLYLVQAIWDTIAAEQALPDLTAAQKEELDRRMAEIDASPDNVLTWDEIKASIRGRK